MLSFLKKEFLFNLATYLALLDALGHMGKKTTLLKDLQHKSISHIFGVVVRGARTRTYGKKDYSRIKMIIQISNLIRNELF